MNKIDYNPNNQIKSNQVDQQAVVNNALESELAGWNPALGHVVENNAVHLVFSKPLGTPVELNDIQDAAERKAVAFQILFAMHTGNTSYGMLPDLTEITYWRQDKSNDKTYLIKTKHSAGNVYDVFELKSEYDIIIAPTSVKLQQNIASASKEFAEMFKDTFQQRFLDLLNEDTLTFGGGQSWGIGGALFNREFKYYKGSRVIDGLQGGYYVYNGGHKPTWSLNEKPYIDTQSKHIAEVEELVADLFAKVASGIPNNSTPTVTQTPPVTQTPKVTQTPTVTPTKTIIDYKDAIEYAISVFKDADNTNQTIAGETKKIREAYEKFYKVDGNMDAGKVGDTVLPGVKEYVFIAADTLEINPYSGGGFYTKVLDKGRVRGHIIILLHYIASVASGSKEMKISDIEELSNDVMTGSSRMDEEKWQFLFKSVIKAFEDAIAPQPDTKTHLSNLESQGNDAKEDATKDKAKLSNITGADQLNTLEKLVRAHATDVEGFIADAMRLATAGVIGAGATVVKLQEDVKAINAMADEVKGMAKKAAKDAAVKKTKDAEDAAAAEKNAQAEATRQTDDRKREAERKEKELERKAKEDADRRAKEDADRKAKEDADRKAEETRLAQEEASRQAQEDEEARNAKEEAEQRARATVVPLARLPAAPNVRDKLPKSHPEYIPQDVATSQAWIAFANNDNDAVRTALIEKSDNGKQLTTEVFLQNVVGDEKDISRLRTQMGLFAIHGNLAQDDSKRRKAYAFSQMRF